MKRYEKISKEELVKIISYLVKRTKYDANCDDCPLHKKGENCKQFGVDCGDAIKDYLNEELTPRIVKINTREELEKAHKEFSNYCNDSYCAICKYYTEGAATGCFVKYLEEEE